MADTPLPFGDIAKALEQFKIPGMDMSSLLDARRGDIQALVDANKAAYETMQALARKQAEMFTEAMQGIQQVASGAGLGDPVKQAEIARNAFQKAMEDMKELADMTRQAQAEAASNLTQRATQHMEELKKMTQAPQAQQPARKK